MSPKEEFVELIAEISRMRGLDDLSSKLIGILYVEPEEISLEELSRRTGYSLSSISTVMKFMCNTGMVKRIKKPKSRKIYFYIEKDMIRRLLDTLKKISKEMILNAREKMPKIIQKYKNEKMPKEELKIAENYYNQLIIMESVMSKFIKILEKEHMKVRQ